MYVCVCVRRMDKNSYNNSTSGGAVTQEEIIDSLNTSDGHKSGNTWHVQSLNRYLVFMALFSILYRPKMLL